MAIRAMEAFEGQARVLIVEDHPVLREVVRIACDASPLLHVVGEAQTGEEAMEASRTLSPDVVLLDLTLRAMDGLELARRLRREGRPVKILVISGRTDDQTVFESVRAGVDGYLEKTSGVRYITDALVRVAAGERVFTRDQERAAIAELGRLARRAREASGLAGSVTPRELEILRHLSRGLTMRQVATRLGVSIRTVETHVAKLYRKLGASNRVQAIAKATDLRLIELG
ncbi:MAG: response regulator [Actinomycetota bacterium]